MQVNSIDRTIAPPIQPIRISRFPQAESYCLNNSIHVLSVIAGQQPVTGFEFIFTNRVGEDVMPGIPSLAMRMLQSGTRKRTAFELSEAISYYGAFWEIQTGANHHLLHVYCLNKFLNEVLALIAEAIQESVLPDSEFEILMNNTRSNIRINLEKTSYLASIKFKNLLFGEFHPYGFTLGEEHLVGVSVEQLRNYYQSNISTQAFSLITAGNADDRRVQAVNDVIGSLKVNTNGANISPQHQWPEYVKTVKIEKEGSRQASIRMGMRTIPRRHPDYAQLLVATEILGGYFGSRLMKNIREEKGLTYGIYAQYQSYIDVGVLQIGSDVNLENVSLAIDEVVKEIKLMQQQPVNEVELQTVKNFMLGQFASQLNTPFSVAELIRNQYLFELPEDHYQTLVDTIRNITAEEVMETMQKYWNTDNLLTVIAGG